MVRIMADLLQSIHNGVELGDNFGQRGSGG
jgi:hypothetical protein